MRKRSVQAAEKMRTAAEHRRMAGPLIPGYENGTMKYHREQAEQFEREGKELLELDCQRERVSGGEVLPIEADRGGMIGVGDPIGIARDTLKDPDSVAIDASTNRIDRLLEAGILATGIDAAHSIGAQNSLEKMLAHQMAACHHMAMKLSARAIDEDDTVEQTRLVNTSARLMRTFQESLLTLQRLRTGGKQTVVVQHVNITEGGQAVIAGKVGRGTDGE